MQIRLPSHWLVNYAPLLQLNAACRCPFKGRHLRVASLFTPQSVELFTSRRRPNCEEVFGMWPRAAQSLASFSASCPLPAMHKMVEIYGLALNPAEHARTGKRTTKDLGFRWGNELASSLPWNTKFQFRFLKANHINVNEYRTLLKHLASAANTTHFAGDPALGACQG